jgi:hypothetical protein
MLNGAHFHTPGAKNGQIYDLWPFLMVKYQLLCCFRDLSSQGLDQLSLNIGMHLFDKNVAMVALFIHLGLKMAKIMCFLTFLIVKCQLPCKFGTLTTSIMIIDQQFLNSTQVIGIRLFHQNVEIVAVFWTINCHFGPKWPKNSPKWLNIKNIIMVLICSNIYN